MDEARPAASRTQGAAAIARQHDYIVGLALLILVVLLWTASNFLTNNILTSGWDKPFAVTYANTSSFALYLIPFALALHKPRRRRVAAQDARLHDSDSKEDGASSFWARIGFALPESPRQRRGSYSRLATSDAVAYDGTNLRLPSPSCDAIRDVRPRLAQGGRPSSIDGRRPVVRLDEEGGSMSPQALPPLTLRETAVLAGQFTLVWFAANWSLTAALGMTSVASGTTLSSASGFFTLGLGSLTGVERVTKAKLLAVLVSFLGVALVTHADSLPEVDEVGVQGPVNARLGDFLALLSAFCYAVYVTLLKLRIKSEDRVSMPLFFGFVGAFNILAMWPVGLGLHLTGWETFQLPSDTKTWVGVGVNMGITFVSDFAYLLSMLKTAPLVATVGLSLTIPLAVFIDLLMGTHSGGTMANIGSLAVLLSFVAIGWDDTHSVGDERGEEDVIRGRRGSSVDEDDVER